MKGTISIPQSMFIRRRWLDFRAGHGTYLALMMTLANFVQITYYFQVESLGLFPDIWSFAAVGLAAYVPLAVTVGVLHRRRQSHVDYATVFENNPAMAKTFKHIIEMLNGRVDPKKTESMIAYLEKIERRSA